jgi:hypothetical protein
MFKSKLSLVNLVIAAEFVAVAPCFASYTENQHESGIEQGMENSTSSIIYGSNEASVSNGNEAGSAHGSLSGSQAGSDNEATFMINPLAGRVIPAIPSGTPPALQQSAQPPSNYVTSYPMYSNYAFGKGGEYTPVVTATTPKRAPKAQIWTATNKGRFRRHGNEMLASRPPKQTENSKEMQLQTPPEMIAPVQTTITPAGFAQFPDPNAFDHE